MYRIKRNDWLAIFFLIATSSLGQQKIWNLQECLQYAEKNNIRLKQTHLQIEQANINKKGAKMAYLPNLNANSSVSWNSGLTQNFTTGILENQTTFGGSGSLSSNLNIFRGFQNHYNYKKSLLEELSAQYQYKDAVKTIQTQIASAYVQILLAKENLENAKQQYENSLKQKEKINELIKAGMAPKGDLIDVEAQVKNDQLKVIQALNSYNLAKLNLAQLLELPEPEKFEIDEKEEDLKVDQSLLIMPSKELFSLAQKNNYKIKSAETGAQIASYQTKLAKSRLYPSLSGFFNYNTRYSDRENIGFGGVITPADPLWTQLKNNKGKTYGLSLNIPIFNGLSARNQVASAKINELKNEYEVINSHKQLQNDIYKMHMDLKAAYQSLKAAEANLKAQQKAYNYAVEKFKVGVINIFDLDNVKLKYESAQYQYINAKYQYFLKSKILEYNIK
jgi:outer membrane protein